MKNSENKTILDYETVDFNKEENCLVIIDQTLLPGKTEIIELKTAQEIWDAIYLLKVRGAPAIGVAAAFGMEKVLRKAQEEGKSVEQIVTLLGEEAFRMKEEDIAVCKAIGENGLSLVKPGDGILTHCNAGQLATCKYGTATAPIYLGQERGYHFRVFADETRPLLQGARLTAYELHSAGVDVTLICDNMSATVMKNGWVNAVFVGCDRVAANGDAANKIGTSVVAAVAKQYGIPMYICAPTSTIDYDCPTGDEIKIEQRKPEEVTEMWYRERMAPEGVKVFNPAFDVTDHSLITAIVTEYGIARAPFTESLAQIRKKKEAAQLVKGQG